MSCQSGNCGGGCNSCHGCCEEQYKSNCYPIISVNCLPTIGRTSSHYIYRTPDDRLWYVNSACNAYLELTCDKEAEHNRLNAILDLTNRIIELEALAGVKPTEEKQPIVPKKKSPFAKEFTSPTLVGTASYTLEHNLDTDTPFITVKAVKGESVQIVNPEIVVLDTNSIKLNGMDTTTEYTVVIKK